MVDNNLFKTKMCAFLGRKINVQILHKYIELALNNNIIDEYHIFDFTRNNIDHLFLGEEYKRLFSKYPDRIYIHNNKAKVFEQPKPQDWSPFYKTISSWDDPNSVIIKCDDDILFIDVYALKDAIRDRWNDKHSFLIHSNCINNGLCAYYLRDKFPKLSKELSIPPKGGLLGPLFEKPELAYGMHTTFISKIKEEWLSYFHIPDQTFTQRISINFILLRGDDLKYLRDVGHQDEYELSSFIPERLFRANKINGSFITSHLSYQLQNKYLIKPQLYNLYEELSNKLDEILMKNDSYKYPHPETSPLSLPMKIPNWILSNHIYIKNDETNEYLYYNYDTFELELSKTKKTLFEYQPPHIMLGIYYLSPSNIKGNFKCETTLIKNMRNKSEAEILIEGLTLKFKKTNQYLSVSNAALLLQTTPTHNSNWIFEYPYNSITENNIEYYRETRVTNGIKKIFYINSETGEEYCNIHSGWSLNNYHSL